MAKIAFTKDYVILSSANKIVAHSFRFCNVRHCLQFPEIVAATKNPVDSSGTNVNDELETKNGGVLCLRVCQCGSHLAACNDNKQLIIYKIEDDFKIIYTRNLPRKALCLAFVQDCKYILVADKTGDVLRFDIEAKDNGEKGELMLGHLSIILDIVVTAEDKFVVTCDRDEKIRVSCYPNCYNIHSYCLGHSEFVIKLDILPNHLNVLISGSGDGTLRFWELQTGKEIGLIHSEEHLPEVYLTKFRELEDDPSERNRPKDKHAPICKLTCNSKNTIAVIYHRLPVIGLYTCEFSSVTERMNCTHDEHLHVPSHPSDICFDSEDRLWVLSLTGVSFVQVYHYQDKNVLYNDDSSTLSQVIKTINSDSEFFNDSIHTPSIIPSLYKQWYDNVSKYLSSKEEKQQKKRNDKKKQPAFSNQSKKQRCK